MKYDRDHLPMPVGEMSLHRKTALTPMAPVTGPFICVTQEGEYPLPEGWVGFVAVDREGYPYPVSQAAYLSTYEPEAEA